MNFLRSVVLISVLSIGATLSHAQENTASTPLPDWLAARIAGYEAKSVREEPIEIWRILHKGQPAYYFVSPCCDQYNPLFSATGQQLCSPSGGIVGSGDGRCPNPADKGSKVVFIWAHPKAPSRERVAPKLSTQ
jgi:hypothetical protein